MKEINSSKFSFNSTFPSGQKEVSQNYNVNKSKQSNPSNEQIQDLSLKNKQILPSKLKFEEIKKQQISPLKQLVNKKVKTEIQIKKLQNLFNKKQNSQLNIELSNSNKPNKIPMFFKKQTKVYTQQQDNTIKRLIIQSENQQIRKFSSKYAENKTKTMCNQQIQKKDRLQKQYSKQNSKFNLLKKQFVNTQKFIQVNKYKSNVDIAQKNDQNSNNNAAKRTNKKRNCSILICNGDNEEISQKQTKQLQNSNKNIKQSTQKSIMSSFFIPKSSQFKNRKVQFSNFREQNSFIPSTIQSSFTSRQQKKLQLSKSNSKSKSKTKLNTSIPSFIKQRQQKNQLLKKSSEKQKFYQKSQNQIEKLSKKQKNNKIWTIKDFQIKQRLGKGAFGDVYLVRQNQLGFFCVLKKLSKKKIKQEKLEQQILRQIKVQSFLNHPHLTKLYGFFDDQQFIYLILQYLTDGSLAQRYNRKKCPQKQTASFIRQICQGLKFMHIEQIIHRDLKPQNIFIDQDYVKIGDFGCSIQTNSKRNTIVGCLAYISPQQLNSQAYDDKIDMWSVGVLCYQLLIGRAPFEEDIKKIANNQKQVLFSQLKFPENIEISTEAKSFTRNLLSLEPQNRMSVIKALKHPFIVKSIQHKQNLQNQVQTQNIWTQQIRLLLIDEE